MLIIPKSIQTIIILEQYLPPKYQIPPQNFGSVVDVYIHGVSALGVLFLIGRCDHSSICLVETQVLNIDAD